MKKVFLLTFVAGALLSLSSCKKEGCTDPDSINYDPSAKTNNGSCQYEGTIVFWYNQSTSTFLQGDGATALTYYVDGVVVGSSSTGVFWTGAPECGQNGTVTVTQDLGFNKSKMIEYSVIDQTGWEYYSGFIEFTANSCSAVQLD